MPDKIIVFIDRVVNLYSNSTNHAAKRGAIDALYAYGEVFLKGNKYVSQAAYLKRKIIELDPMYEQIFEEMASKKKRTKLLTIKTETDGSK